MAEILYNFFNFLFGALSLLILVRVLMSWIPNLDPSNPLVRLIHQLTDPILEPARRLIPPIGGLDLSPLIVLLVIDFVIRPLTLQLLARLM
jgi:YggT family protein